jgi:hypothetical protein
MQCFPLEIKAKIFEHLSLHDIFHTIGVLNKEYYELINGDWFCGYIADLYYPQFKGTHLSSDNKKHLIKINKIMDKPVETNYFQILRTIFVL